MSIIVGYLPTLRPLVNHFKRHSYKKQNDVYPLNDNALGRDIRKTVTIDMDVTNTITKQSSQLRHTSLLKAFI